MVGIARVPPGTPALRLFTESCRLPRLASVRRRGPEMWFSRVRESGSHREPGCGQSVNYLSPLCPRTLAFADVPGRFGLGNLLPPGRTVAFVSRVSRRPRPSDAFRWPRGWAQRRGRWPSVWPVGGPLPPRGKPVWATLATPSQNEPVRVELELGVSGFAPSSSSERA